MKNLWCFSMKMFLSLVLLTNGLIQAEIPFTWIKGLYAVTGENRHLSPINGLVWYRQNIVKNMYDIWRVQPADKKDNTIKLIEEIFYLQRDGVSFLPTKLPLKSAAYFTPSDIGKMIATIQQYRVQVTDDKGEFAGKIKAIIGESIQVEEKKLKMQLEKMQRQKDYPILSQTIETLDKFFKNELKRGAIPKEVKNYLKQKHKSFDLSKINPGTDALSDFLNKLKNEKQEEEKNQSLQDYLSLLQEKKEVQKLKYSHVKLLKSVQELEEITQAKITKGTRTYLDQAFPTKINFDEVKSDDIGFKEFLEKLKITEKDESKVLTGRQALLQEKLAPFDKLFNELEHKIQMTKKASDEKSLVGLASFVVGSVRESSGDEGRYIIYTTEQILLAFLWAKSDAREDLKAFFDALGQKYTKTDELEAWTIKKFEYVRDDYKEFQKMFAQINAGNMSQFIEKHYEIAVFAVRAFQMWDQPLPFIFTGIMVDYKKDGNVYSFPDCGETSLRNFFNIILKNPDANKFDINYLLNPKLIHEDMPLKISDKLKEFYINNSSLDNVTLQQIYNDWTQVVEDLSGVSYVEPSNESNHYYEISAGLNNILQVLNHLLFGNNEKFKKLSKTEKLNFICAQLSRNTFELTWKATDLHGDSIDIETNDYDLILHFIVKTKSHEVSFDWKFEINHFVIPDPGAQGYPISTEKIDAIAKMMQPINPIDKVMAYNLLSSYASKDNFGVICQAAHEALPGDQLAQLIYLYTIREVSEVGVTDIFSTSRGKVLEAMSNIAIKGNVPNLLLEAILKRSFLTAKSDAKNQMIMYLFNLPQMPQWASYIKSDKEMKLLMKKNIRFLQDIIVKNKVELFGLIKEKMMELSIENKGEYGIALGLVLLIGQYDRQALFDIAKQKAGILTVADRFALVDGILQNGMKSWYDFVGKQLMAATEADFIVNVVSAIVKYRREDLYSAARNKINMEADPELKNKLEYMVPSASGSVVEDWDSESVD